jgi:hypothetical protein
VLGDEVPRQHDRSGKHVLCDRPFVIEGVGHQHLWRYRTEVDASVPAPTTWISRNFSATGRHLGGDPPPDVHRCVTQLVHDGIGLADQPRHVDFRWQGNRETFAMRNQIASAAGSAIVAVTLPTL